MDTIQEKQANIKLTSAEITNLWTSYLTDSMSICVLKYFLEKVEDPEIRPVIKNALSLSQNHIQTITGIFNQENFPIPYGFKDDDVNLTAPRLYSDNFALIYIHNMAKLGLQAYSTSLSVSIRLDVKNFYSQNLTEANQLYDQTLSVLLSKGGIFQRPPYIPYPEKVEFVQKQNFLTGWLGDLRPLNVAEITHLYFNIQRNAVGKVLVMGFSQVAQSKKVREFMVRGKEISAKHIEIFTSLLVEDDLPYIVTWDSDVTPSTIAPFSDKLMMYHTTTLISSSFMHFGLSLSSSLRRDLTVHYTRLMGEIGLYAEDGANIMINNGWMEQPPQQVDRKTLAGV